MKLTHFLIASDERGYFQDLFASLSEVVEPSSEENEEGISKEPLRAISRKVRKLKVGKSAGVDKIRTEFIKNSVSVGIQ